MLTKYFVFQAPYHLAFPYLPACSYTFVPRGSVQVALTYTGYFGPATVASSWNYTQVSPFISSLLTGSGVLTGEQLLHVVLDASTCALYVLDACRLQHYGRRDYRYQGR